MSGRPLTWVVDARLPVADVHTACWINAWLWGLAQLPSPVRVVALAAAGQPLPPRVARVEVDVPLGESVASWRVEQGLLSRVCADVGAYAVVGPAMTMPLGACGGAVRVVGLDRLGVASGHGPLARVASSVRWQTALVRADVVGVATAYARDMLVGSAAAGHTCVCLPPVDAWVGQVTPASRSALAWVGVSAGEYWVVASGGHDGGTLQWLCTLAAQEPAQGPLLLHGEAADWGAVPPELADQVLFAGRASLTEWLALTAQARGVLHVAGADAHGSWPRVAHRMGCRVLSGPLPAVGEVCGRHGVEVVPDPGVASWWDAMDSEPSRRRRAAVPLSDAFADLLAHAVAAAAQRAGA